MSASTLAESAVDTGTLLVQRATWEAEGVLSLRLVDPAGAALAPWTPGAHVDLILPSGLVRQYSLCGDPDDRAGYTVAVRLDPDGRGGSREVHSTALVGSAIGLRGPRNRFELLDAPGYMLIAGGIGITPLVPMLQELRRRDVPRRLVYGGRSMKSMPFVRELRQTDPDKVEFVPEDRCGVPDLDGLISGLPTGTTVYCCGPEGLLSAVEWRCGRRPDVDLHMERFAATPAAGGGAFEVELRRSGVVLSVPPERSLLDVVRDAVPGVMSSCEEGFCGTCETRVLDGTPEHHDTILSAAERDRGTTMMLCVGRSSSPRLVLDL